MEVAGFFFGLTSPLSFPGRTARENYARDPLVVFAFTWALGFFVTFGDGVDFFPLFPEDLLAPFAVVDLRAAEACLAFVPRLPSAAADFFATDFLLLPADVFTTAVAVAVFFAAVPFAPAFFGLAADFFFGAPPKMALHPSA